MTQSVGNHGGPVERARLPRLSEAHIVQTGDAVHPIAKDRASEEARTHVALARLVEVAAPWEEPLLGSRGWRKAVTSVLPIGDDPCSRRENGQTPLHAPRLVVVPEQRRFAIDPFDVA